MRICRAVCLVVCFLHISGVKAQIDTLFWFAAPEVSAHVSNFDIPLYLNITAIDKDAVVEISIPANPSITPLTRNIVAGTSAQVDISAWKTDLENEPYDQILNKGLRIRSTGLIQVYYDMASTYCNCNPEIFTLKGNNALGTNFYIPSQTTINNSDIYQPSPRFSFDIVATENQTKITITPSIAIYGHAANTPFSVTLNKGQTFSSAALSTDAASHPAGTLVVSDKPIAITIKDDLLEGLQFAGGCADLTGDQIVPSNITGKQYVLVKGKLGTGANEMDLACMTATKDNTEIYVDGNLMYSLNAGQNITHEVRNANTYIESTQPIYVLQISGLGCELGSALLPPVQCTGSKIVGLRRSASKIFLLYLNIICPKGAEGDFIVNGSAGIIKASDFIPVNGTANWVSASVLIDSNIIHTNQSMIISNAKGAFHLGVFEGGFTNGAAYGYISNYGRNTIPLKTFMPCKDSLVLAARLSADSVKWFNGSKANSVVINQAGIYWVDNYTPCEKVRDSFIVIANTSKTYKKALFCYNNVLKPIDLKGHLKYLWNTGDTISTLIPDINSTNYWVDITSTCGVERDSFVSVKIKLPADTVICGEVDILLNTHLDETVWNNKTVDSELHIVQAGTYIAKYSNAFCAGISDTMEVKLSEQSAKVFLPTAFTPNDDGINDYFPSQLENLAAYHLIIYNRWGEKIFDEQLTNWYGNYKDVMVEDGIYLYLFEYADCRNVKRWEKGTVTLVK